jgi:predicted nucleotidyltransferase
MKDGNLLVRVDSNVKKKAMKVAKKQGVSLSSLVNAFLVELAETGNIPEALGKNRILSLSCIKSMVLRIIQERPMKFVKVYLVGSYAKGTADEHSDIDLLVYPGEEADLGDLGHLQYTLQQMAEKEVDIIDANGANKEFLRSLKKGERLIYKL